MSVELYIGGINPNTETAHVKQQLDTLLLIAEHPIQYTARLQTLLEGYNYTSSSSCSAWKMHMRLKTGYKAECSMGHSPMWISQGSSKKDSWTLGVAPQLEVTHGGTEQPHHLESTSPQTLTLPCL